jgi:hypothetical protein
MLCFLKKHQGKVKYNSEIHEYNTRKKHDLHIQHCNTVLYKKGVKNMGKKLFKKIPKKKKKKNGITIKVLREK